MIYAVPSVLAKKLALTKERLYGLIGLAVVLALVPVFLGFNFYYVLLATNVMLAASLVASWNIIGGYAGQLDLAASAYMALGAVVTGHLLASYGLTPWIGMFLGAGLAVVVAILVGYPTFRFGIKEVWYALLTSALVVILMRIYYLIYGSFETYIPHMEPEWLYLSFRRYEVYYYLLAAMVVIVVWINLKIKSSKLGYYLAAIREDELAAEALGIDVRRYKLYALMIYAALAGIIGGIYITLTGILSYRLFDPWLGIVTAVMGIVGGLGSVEGAVLAAVILRSLEEYLRGAIGATYPGSHLLVYGIILILVGVLKPEGLASLIRYIKNKLFYRNRER